MKRAKDLKVLMLVSAMALLTACGSDDKVIPKPVTVEPEAEAAHAPTEGSLWPGETSRSTLFSDKKATRVGDIITVHVVEKTKALNSASLQQRRSETANVNMQMISPGGNPGNTAGFRGRNDWRGSGATARTEQLSTTVSAMVTEVMENGLLKIDGQRRMKINDATQYISVSGLVRPEDINYDNSILSSKIANATISYDGVGSLDRGQGGGWGKRWLDKYWPF